MPRLFVKIAVLPLCACLAVPSLAPAQAQEAEPEGTGTLEGVVSSLETGEPVGGAEVRVVGTELRTVAGADGSYSLAGIPAGPYTVEAVADGFYGTTPVVVVAGRTRRYPLGVIPIESLVVAGQPPRGASTRALEQRRGSVETKETVSKQDMGRAPGSSVAEVSKRLPGVNLQDGKFVYVRGLGERYSQTLVNRATIPSPEPDKRVIPLDLFPANLVESLSVAKSYSPDLPGEFAGGSVQLETVDVPRDPFVKLGGGVRYRHNTTFRDFKTYHGGNLDKFTFDDGTRALPDEVPFIRVKGGGPPRGLTDDELVRVGQSFPNIWEPDTSTAPLDHAVNLSFGRSFGDPTATSLGVVGALNWANKYLTVEGEKRRILLNEGTIDQPDVQVFNEFDLDSSIAEAEVSALLNVTLQLNEGQRVGVRNMYTRSAEDEVRIQTGRDNETGRELEITRLRWVERGLFTTQGWGEHLLVGDLLFEWRGGYALSQRDEPDNRQVRYDFEEALQDFRFANVPGSGRRDYFLLDENIYDASADLSIPFNPLGVEAPSADPRELAPRQKIKLGGAFTFRDRDLDTRRFRFQQLGSPPRDSAGNVIDLTSSPEDLFEDKNINPQGFGVEENTEPTDNYEATQTLLAGYGLADFRLHRRVRLQVGARVEESDQEVTTFELFAATPTEVESSLKTLDVLPAANLTWEFSRDMLLRLGGSQTVSRPEFRELSQFQYTDLEGGFVAQGNPDLQRAKIWNADLRWEWYPTDRDNTWHGDLISAGVFYKKFDQPIEQVYIPSSAGFRTTWDNADTADLYGVEFEVRQKLWFLNPLFGWKSPELEALGFIANLALVDSEVRLEGEGNVQTNDRRPLQGQARYLFNAGIIFEPRPPLDFSLSILVNSVGERISNVGAFGVPDEKEQPRWSLDMSFEKRFGRHSSLRLTAENLLEDPYVYKQGGITTREYKVGFTVGISYHYTF